MQPRALVLTLIVLSSVGSTLSCERFTRTRQCRALISRVNTQLDEIEAGTGKQDKQSYSAAAARYEQLANELGPLEFSSAQMARDVAEYAALLRQTAKQLRAASTALDDPDKLATARNELAQLSAREKMSVAKMDAWCHAR